MLNDATQERASTQSPGSWGSRRSQKSSNTPAVSAGFVLLQGMFVPAPFPHTHADSVHELSISTSELSTCSSGTELTATGKGRAFCPLLSADGLGELVATHRSWGSGQAWRVPSCPCYPKDTSCAEGLLGDWGWAVPSGLCCKPGKLSMRGTESAEAKLQRKKNTAIMSCLFVWDSKESKVSGGSRCVIKQEVVSFI